MRVLLPAKEVGIYDPIALEVADNISDVIAADSRTWFPQTGFAFDPRWPQGFREHANDQASVPVAERPVECPVQARMTRDDDWKALVFSNQEVAGLSKPRQPVDPTAPGMGVEAPDVAGPPKVRQDLATALARKITALTQLPDGQGLRDHRENAGSSMRTADPVHLLAARDTLFFCYGLTSVLARTEAARVIIKCKTT